MSWDKIENHLFDKYDVEGEDKELSNLMKEHDKEVKAKAIDEAIDEAAKTICVGCGYLEGHNCTYKGSNCGVSKPMLEVVVKALKQMKAGGKNE